MNRQKPIQTKRLFLLTVLTAFFLLNLSYANAEDAYWTTGRGIQRGALGNGAPETIIPVTLGVPNGIAIDPVSGKMYWGDTGTRKIQRSNLDGSNIEDLVEVETYDLAIDLAAGKIYWTTSDTIQRANLDGSNIEELVIGLLFPTGIALDPAAGKMYWTDFLDGTIQRANLDGSAVETLVSDLESPQGIALDTTAGKIYWTDDLDDTIQRANLDGSGVEILITGLENPNGIALGSGGVKMYWTSPAKIQQADLDGGNIEDLVSNLVFPQDIAAPGGGKMYWTAPAKIQRADIDGSNIEDLITSELSSPQGIAIDPGDGGLAANGKIYWVDAGTRKIQRSNLDGSNIEDLATGLNDPTGLALDPAGGKMYWTTFAAIQRANLDGSNIETLVTDPDVLLPQGIAVDPGGGKMYWVDLGLIIVLSSVKRANLDGSEIEVLVTRGMFDPADIAVNTTRNKIYWTQFNRIRQAKLNGNFPQDFVTGVAPTGIEVDSGGGKIYWSSFDVIQRANFDGSNVEDVFTGLFSPRYIALDVPPGGCPLTQLVPESKPNALTDLRQFRDNVLTTSPTGQELTRLYYHHASEITSILWQNPLKSSGF
jgi:DNA-binding beta-propeller fold protein YncE